MNYLQVTKYLDSFINYENNTDYKYKVSLKLERVKGFLELIGNPHKSFRSIHIAGTKGKGSTCVFCAYILRGLGYKTGLYTSPHLNSIRERVRILPTQKNNEDVFEGIIPEKDFCLLVEELKPKIDAYSQNSIYGPLSYFEIITSIAFMYFKKQKVDFAVLETGLGGRLDATNIVEPLVCGITTIGFDHMDKLGNTLNKIAQEKAGIIKKNNRYLYPIVVSAIQNKVVNKVLIDKCKKEQLLLWEVGKDIVFKMRGQNNNYQIFDVRGIFGEIENLKIKLLGEYQVINASVALGIIFALEKLNQLKFNLRKIKKALWLTQWPVRFEVISTNPKIVLDGAHNQESMQVLVKTVKEKFSKNRVVFILGVSQDKDIKNICNYLLRQDFKIILTKSDNPRAANPQDIAGFLRGEDVTLTKNIRCALKMAQECAINNTVIVVAGSIFLAAEARRILLKINY